MLVGAMMFGYMMSTIRSMVAAMDREAAIREDRMDAVKEWIASRNMPHNLFVRVRKYYEHYYMKKSALNEDDILEQLTPGLRNDVTSVLLQESLGLFPLFTLMGVGFQCAVYPLLTPLACANQDTIFQRGESSEDHYFLRKGTVDVLAGGARTEVLYRVNQGQYFGEEVLTGQRRYTTVVSNGFTELWSLAKEDLLGCAAWARPRGLVPSHAKWLRVVPPPTLSRALSRRLSRCTCHARPWTHPPRRDRCHFAAWCASFPSSCRSWRSSLCRSSAKSNGSAANPPEIPRPRRAPSLPQTTATAKPLPSRYPSTPSLSLLEPGPNSCHHHLLLPPPAPK